MRRLRLKQGDAQLGVRYRDKVTGFEGVAVSAHIYIAGCTRLTLEKLNADGDKLIALTFDEPNLERLEPVVVEQRVKTGGPHDHDSPLDGH